MRCRTLWSEVELGVDTKVMQKTLRLLEWLSRGYEISLNGRTIGLHLGLNDSLVIVNRATCVTYELGNETKLPDTCLGLGDSLSFLYSEIAKLSEDEFLLLAANCAITEINKKKRPK